MGIDDEKIRRVKNGTQSTSGPFTFLITDQFIDIYSNAGLLVDAFIRLFKNNPAINLKVISSVPYFPLAQNLDLCLSSSYKYLIENSLRIRRLVHNDYLDAIKRKCENITNVSIVQSNLSDEDYTREINKCSCFVHLDSKLTISTYVLEAFAMGKKAILPADNRYNGYLSDNDFLGVDIERVSEVFCEYQLWTINSDIQPKENYSAVNQVKVEALEKILMYAVNNKDALRVEPAVANTFIEKFSWTSIGEKLREIIYN